jgi:hypothetical protein
VCALFVAAQAASAGVKTTKDPYLSPAAPGVIVDPILSTGDIVGGYQMSGIPDGLGAYLSNNGGDDGGDNGGGTLTVVMNHELVKTATPFVDSRISRLEIDPSSRSVDAASYLFTGLEGYQRFCSATLSLISGRPFYFTGEENAPDGHDGSSIALDPETGMWRDTKHFGHLNHENIVPIRLAKWVFLTSDDNFRSGVPSFLYAYIANSFNGAIRGTEGSLYVWKADDDVAKTGTATIVKGESVPGHFIPVTQAENSGSIALTASSTAKKAFQFDRLEDIALRPDVRGRAYISDTGKDARPKGKVYQFDINPGDPTKATLKVLLDGNAADDIRNPDNLDASSKVLVIQEDRESIFRNDPNRVLVYRFGSKTLTTAAFVTPIAGAPSAINNAESSGVIDASRFLGANWWLLDVQAHNRVEKQPGSTLEPNSSTGEDGQLDALYIPNSTSGGGD